MATLADKIRLLRGDRSYADFAKLTRVSRQKLNDLEAGETGKISTLRKIADACNVNEAEWTEMLISWVEVALGDESQKFVVLPAGALRGLSFKAGLLLFLTFFRLNSHDQAQLLKAAVRERVRACLPPINAAYEAVPSPEPHNSDDPLAADVYRLVDSLEKAPVPPAVLKDLLNYVVYGTIPKPEQGKKTEGLSPSVTEKGKISK